jgi:segregation and condensation protein A
MATRSRVSAATQLELHLETFDGPLELLLLLIEQRRLPITQVSLAQVADQYLAQVHAAPSLDTELLADFLVIGGKLLLLKSRALLLTEEPDPEVEEVASDLAERLATYRVFRAAAEVLRELEQRGERTYPTLREATLDMGPAPLAPLGPEALLAVWRRFASEPRQVDVEIPGISRASVDERRARILDALRAAARVSFRELAGDSVDQVVATFLAVLELFRRGLIQVEQPAPFGDLTLQAAATAGAEIERVFDR